VNKLAGGVAIALIVAGAVGLEASNMKHLIEATQEAQPTVTAAPKPTPTSEAPKAAPAKKPTTKQAKGVTVACWTDCSDEDDYITSYRAESEDFHTPDKVVLGTVGLVCVAVKNRPNAEVHEDLTDLKGLTSKQADGLIYASQRHCSALGW
jgi:hypothetical protein